MSGSNGGDVKGEENGETDLAIWRAMGEAYKETCPDHLVTFHPWGPRSSSFNFHHDDWLGDNGVCNDWILVIDKV